MHGMHGVSGNRTMPVNCGMQGMHGNTAATKAQKTDNSVDKLQNVQVAKLPGDTKGNAIDVKI